MGTNNFFKHLPLFLQTMASCANVDLKGCFVLVVAFIFLPSGALVLVHSTANLFARFTNLIYIMITRLLLGICKESKVFGLCIGS